MASVFGWLVLIYAVFSFGCAGDDGDSCKKGGEGCACHSGGTCSEGLICLSDRCVNVGAYYTTEMDGGGGAAFGAAGTGGMDSGTEVGDGCPAYQTECAGKCLDTNSDSVNCGGCGRVCPAGTVCDGSGRCAVTCAKGRVVCNGVCVDPAVDRNHCGASGDCEGANAGNVCEAGEVCGGSGVCELSCQAGLVNCDGVCIDPYTSRETCGASGDCRGEKAGTVCAAGEICSAGACAPSCRAGLVNCDGTCIDPKNDRNYCGASDDCTGDNTGAVCADGEVCNGAGTCELQCQQGLLDCNGVCVNPLTDRAYCGARDNCRNSPGVTDDPCLDTLLNGRAR